MKESANIFLKRIAERINSGEFDEDIPFLSKHLMYASVKSRIHKKIETGATPILTESEIKDAINDAKDTAMITYKIFKDVGVIDKDNNIPTKWKKIFDETLELQNVQNYVKTLINRNIEVWIVTSRYSDDFLINNLNIDVEFVKLLNSDLYDIANKLGIQKNRIHFTNLKYKYNFLENNKFLFHADDDYDEIQKINNNTNVIGIYLFDEFWKTKCESLIKLFK